MPYTTFPLYAVKDGECTCPEGATCLRPGKHPAVRWARLGAGEQVPLRPGQGMGIATGERSGVFVVDTDTDAATAAMLEACPPTYMVKSPRAGEARHFYFLWPGFRVRNSASELAQGIDVRGDGGFVVAPGSPHKSGGVYVEAPESSGVIAEAPAWLLEWPGLRDVARLRVAGELAPTPVDVTTEEGARAITLARATLPEMPPAVRHRGENGSGKMWNVALYLMRDLCLPLGVALELVEELYNPSCTPPFSRAELTHKLQDARDKSDQITGAALTDIADALHEVMGAPTPAAHVTRRQKDPAHRYSANVGDLANGKKDPVGLAEASNVLWQHPDWEGVLQWDEFSKEVRAVDPPIPLDAERETLTDTDCTRIRIWFETVYQHNLGEDAAWKAIRAVAERNTYHPVREYLRGLPVQSPDLLDDAARLWFGSDDPLDRVLVRKFLIASVRRVLGPGCKADSALVLSGAQGKGKSSFVAALFGEFATEDLPDITTKDAMQSLQGVWGIEIAEVDRVLRVDPSVYKAFLSKCSDRFRAPYDRVLREHARQCVFVGTTNQDELFRDPTGDRRSWALSTIGTIDLAAVHSWRDRMWSAAYAAALTEEKHHLDAAHEEALKERLRGFQETDPWHETIADYCAGREFVRTDDIWRECLGGTVDKFDARVKHRIVDTLRRLGCVNTATRKLSTDKQVVRAWRVSAELQGASPSHEERTRRNNTN